MHNEVVTVLHEGDVAWVTINYPPVNATATPVRAGLFEAVAAVQGSKVAFLKCEGRTFIAGGDMSEFDAPAVEPFLSDVVQAIENSNTPFIALLHGTVLGGGFEIAMGCAWRLAAKGTRFGLPEVNVGLIPGAGGTQRAPRLLGMEAAIAMACSGEMFTAKKMLELGGIDAVVDGKMMAAALEFAEALPARPTPISQRPVAPLDESKIQEARAKLTQRAKGQKSPLENLDALLWSQSPFEVGQPKERKRHIELRHTPESRALRHAFFAERIVARPDAIKGTSPRDIENIAIVGGGLMGAGIATACLGAGFNVALIERDDDAASAAKDRIAGLIEGGVKRGKISAEKRDAQLQALATTAHYASASNCDMAIEAVFEDAAVKQTVFENLAAVMSPDAILATNTSYIDPLQIFEGIPNAYRCIGLHFFSPAHIMKLLEIVKTPETSADVIATGFELGRRLRKISVLSGICDGFIGNRMLAAYRREADYLLADGALPYQIDAAMRDFGMPMGPYELQDLTGLQIGWANRKRQAPTRPKEQRYVPIADQLCELERFGQRSGKGWYRYEQGNRTPIRDHEVEAIIVAYSKSQGIEHREFSAAEIQDRLMAVLANEGALIVNEGIAETTAAVDMVKLHGYGFPRWRGGPMQYAKEIGWDNTTEMMQRVCRENPDSWQVAYKPKGL